MNGYRSTDYIGKDVIVTPAVGEPFILTDVRKTCRRDVVGTKTTRDYIGTVVIGFSDMPGLSPAWLTDIREA